MHQVSFVHRVRVVALAVIVSATFALSVYVARPAAATPSCSASTFTVTRISSPVIYLDTGSTPAVNSAYEGYQITNSSGSAYNDVWVTTSGFAGGAKIHLGTYATPNAHLGTLSASATKNAYFYLTADGATSSSESHTISVFASRPDLGSAVCSTTVSLDVATDISAAANKVTGVTTSAATPNLGGSFTITVNGNTGTIGAAGIFATSPASLASWPANAFTLSGSQIVIGSTTYNNTLYLSGLASGGTYTATFTFNITGITTSSSSVSPISHISSGTQVKHTSMDSTYQSIAAIPVPSNTLSVSLGSSSATLPSSGGSATFTLTATNSGAIPLNLDDIVAVLPTGATYTTSSATWGGSSVPNPTISGQQLTFVDQLTVPASGTRTFTFGVSFPATSGDFVTSIVSHIGTVQIDSTTSTTDNAPATATVTVLSPPPTVSGVSPATGTSTGGTNVTVNGTGFSGVTGVDFSGVAATSFTVNSTTSLTAVAPAGSVGTVDITVTTPTGTSPAGASDEYTYAALANNAPSYTGAATNTAQTVSVGATPSALVATDPDGDSLAYSVTSGSLPAGVSLSSNGHFNGQATTAGNSTIDVQVSDGHGGAATTTVALHVRNIAATVTFDAGASLSSTNTTPDISGSTTAPVGSTMTVSVGGQTLTTTVQSGGTWVVTPTTLALNSYTVTATVSDAYGNLGSNTMQLDVTAPPTTTTTSTSTTTTTVAPTTTTTTTVPTTTTTVAPGTTTTAPATTTTLPSLPSTPPLTSRGPTTATQTVAVNVPVNGSVALVNNGVPVSQIIVPGKGTYSLNTATGEMTFTPVPGYRGTPPPATYEITDTYGQSAVATFSPTVVGPTKGGTTDVTPNDDGYWWIQPNGGVTPKGTASGFGSMEGKSLNASMVGVTTTANAQGYWEAGADGGVFAFGNANFCGSMANTKLNGAVVSIASTPDAGGYWMTATDGGVFAFGNADFYGSMATTPLNGKVVGLSPTLDGKGYWLAASDGGVFAFGDATFYGSMAGITLNAPIVGMAPTPDGGGYWLAAADGGVFAFGDARFYGSTGSSEIDNPIVGIIATPDGGGYSLVDADGRTINFGNGHL